MTIPTNAQIELMTIAQLTAFWNVNCAAVERAPIKKFTDKAQGIKRCNELAAFLRKQQETAKPVAKATKAAKQDKPKAERKASVSGTCQRLILDGKSNADIWAVLKEQFNLDDSKKYYPAWNRAMMTRKGLIKKEG